MKLGAKSRYAVTALVDLAMRQERTPVALSDIAIQHAIPMAYLEQLFRRLRKAGIVSSCRGHQGGYILTKPCHETKISDIILAVDEVISSTACASKRGCQSPSVKCLTHDLWEGLDRHVISYLEKISLQDLMPSPKRPAPLSQKTPMACENRGNLQ